MPLVRGATAHRVLPIRKVRAEGPGPLRGADQGDDRGVPIVWLPNGGASAGVQQEHGSTDLSAHGLTGPQTTDWLPSTRSSPAVGGQRTERAPADQHVPRLGWP